MSFIELIFWEETDNKQVSRCKQTRRHSIMATKGINAVVGEDESGEDPGILNVQERDKKGRGREGPNHPGPERTD